MMDARSQQDAAAAFEAVGWHFYCPASDGSGNVKRLLKIPWATALVKIQRGEGRGWILARDATEPSACPLYLVPNNDTPTDGASNT